MPKKRRKRRGRLEDYLKPTLPDEILQAIREPKFEGSSLLELKANDAEEAMSEMQFVCLIALKP